MAKLSQSKDNPKIVETKLNDGRISLALDYYIGRDSVPVLDDEGNPVLYTSGAMEGKPKYKVIHNRRREALSLYIYAKPRTPDERTHNKETIELAERIRYERAQEFLQDREGYRLKRDSQMDFYAYFESFIYNYQKKDIRMVRAALRDFREFIASTKTYSRYKDKMTLEQLDAQMVRKFVDWLLEHHEGEGAHTVYARFKKVIKYAYDTEIIPRNPCNNITIHVDKGMLTKDILSQEEVRQLIATKYKGQNENIRRAFILSLFCGLRWCDVKDITYGNIDYANKLLRFEQNKTKGHSSASGVAIPLSDSLIALIGTGKRTEVIFPLPSHTMCLKALRHWVARAGIDKHITWHCARHSFATNILSNGANIKTVASLLGHSGLQHTEKYVRAVDKLKDEAIKSLGEIEI